MSETHSNRTNPPHRAQCGSGFLNLLSTVSASSAMPATVKSSTTVKPTTRVKSPMPETVPVEAVAAVITVMVTTH